ncbi:MAG: TIGR03862 family flavoprotein [Actinomycetes bacterium]
MTSQQRTALVIPAQRNHPTAAVVGGGPGGLMAAEVLARNGALVTIYEQMPTMGRKLLIAGRGGLNITHSEPLPEFLSKYGEVSPSLRFAIEAFPPTEVRAWCAGLFQETFVGTSGRVFPSGFRATELLRNWLGSLEGLGVDLQNNRQWIGWDEATGALLIRNVGQNNAVAEPISSYPDITVMSLGGGSWARTGSDGSWVHKYEAAGIKVKELTPANSGFLVDWTAEFISRFEGVPIKNIALVVGENSVRGELMISSEGIEGGAVYAVGRELREACGADGKSTVEVDLRPDLTRNQIEKRLDTARPKDSTSTLLQRCIGLPLVSIGLMREATTNNLPRSPAELAGLLKSLPLSLRCSQGNDRAISTAGGVVFEELDERYMLRSHPGTFVAGEMIDWEAPTGGYLLQATLSTAVAAASGALFWWAEQQG